MINHKLSKKNLLIVAMLLSSSLLFGACSQSKFESMINSEKKVGDNAETAVKSTEDTPKIEKIAGFKLYENSEAGVSIQYPEDWETQEDFMGCLVFFKSPQKDSSDKFQENINVVVQDLKGQKVSLDKYTEISVEQVKTMITDALIVENPSKTSVNGLDARRISYTGRQGQYQLKWQQIYFIENGKAYVLTYTAEKDQYQNYLSQAEKIFNSIDLE